MRSIRHILLASVLTVSAFSAVTFTSCKKDDNGCAVGYTGSNCKTEVRTTYYNTYKGNGSDNTGDTYTNFSIRFSALGTDPLKMSMVLQDATTAPVVAATVTLTSNTTFTVDQTSISGYTYTGTGTVNESSASLSLTEVGGTPSTTVVYTFSNMLKQ
jgi:hypothetical protein